MRQNRLKLVVPECSVKAATEGMTEVRAVPPAPDAGIRRLRLVDPDEGPPSDDAA
jgi:hypothetical protein